MYIYDYQDKRKYCIGETLNLLACVAPIARKPEKISIGKQKNSLLHRLYAENPHTPLPSRGAQLTSQLWVVTHPGVGLYGGQLVCTADTET